MLINLQHMELPRGFEFNPKDEDAIFFLNKKVSRRPLAVLPFVFGGGGGRMILELDPYDLKQLPDIFSATDKLGSLYFFTKLRRKSTVKDASTNIDRTVRGKTKKAGGNWHGGTKNKEIKDGRGKVIGISRKLSYRPAPGTAAAADSRNHNRYIMTEYFLPCKETNYDIFKDGVLCRLVKNNRPKNGDESAANFPSQEEVEATPSEIPPNQTLAASEDGDDHELLDSIQLAFHELLEDGDGDQELLDNPAANSGSPTAADSPHTYEVEAPAIPLEYSTAAVEIPPLQTLVDVDQHAGDNQVMDYYSYTAEVEAPPNSVDDLPVLSTTVDIPPPHSVVDFEDGNEESYNALMAMNFEDVSQMIDWTMEPLVGEEYSTAVEIPPLNQTQVAVEHGTGDNIRVVTYDTHKPIAATSFSMVACDSYTCEVEATTINNPPGVEDGSHKLAEDLPAKDYENSDNQLGDWTTSEAFKFWTSGDEFWPTSELFDGDEDNWTSQLSQFTPSIVT